MPIPQRIAMMLFEGVNSVDVAGPLEAFASVRNDRGEPAYRITTWSLGALRLTSESGLQLLADERAPDAPRADLLFVPGGPGVREPATLRALGAWLRRHHSKFRRVAAICTGAYALAESGLVDGRRITTHWAHAQDLRLRYPRVQVDDGALYLRDGRFYTAGGVTSGIDLALHLIEQDCGHRAAIAAARELVVFMRRPGGQSQFSAPLRLQASAPAELAEVCTWAAGHLDADLSVETLAARANLSARQLTRRFREAFDTTPARYMRALRLDAARTALAQPRASVARIARHCGFENVEVFRRAFERQYRTSPNEYRRRFAAREV